MRLRTVTTESATEPFVRQTLCTFKWAVAAVAGTAQNC
jgi:hypothetical protein